MATTPTPSQVTEYQTGFAPQIAPYAERMLGAMEGTVFQYERDAQGNVVMDASGMPKIKGFQPYQQYQGARVAQFSPLQQRAIAEAELLGPAGQLADASGIAGLAAQRALGYGYTPGKATNQFVAPEQFQPSQITAPGISTRDLTRYEMGPVKDVGYRELTAPQMQAAQTGYAPEVRAAEMQAALAAAAPTVTSRDIQAAQSQYRPDLQTFQMGPAERIGTQSFTQAGSAQQFMSPYMQQVVDVEKREAQRQADIARESRGARYAKAGAFGGARQAIEEAEAARNLATQKGDIQARGMQSAYQQAQAQFNAEQQARLAAAQANQQAGLTTGIQNLAAALGVQQLGAGQRLQVEMANLTNEQQARVQNEANRLQASGMSAQMAQQTALANQQAQQQAAAANQQAQMQAQQLATQTGLQTSLANLNAAQQAAVQNQAAQLQAQGMTAQQAMQAALANQQAGLTIGQQNLGAALGTQQLGAQQDLQARLANQQAQMQAQQLAEQSKQFGYGQAMQAAGLGAQYGQAAQQLNEQSAQYGAGLGLQGLQTAMQGAGQLGNLGQAQFGQKQAAIGLQSQLGGQQQQQAQNILNQQYQDFLNYQNQPYKQLGFMSDIMRGAPLTQTGSSVYQQAPSMMSQIAGLGTAAIGASKLFGAKGGGVVPRPAGLADLAIYNMGA